MEQIRIFHGCEVQIEKSVRGSLFGIKTLFRVMLNRIPRDRSVANIHDRFFFLHTFSSPTVDFNAEVAINEWSSYTLMSAILKTDVVCDVPITSIPNILMTELHDLLYNQCIDNICCFSLFIYPMWWIRVCKIKLISTGENRGKPCLVCKKSWVSEDN